MRLRTEQDALKYLERSGWGLAEIDDKIQAWDDHPEFCRNSLSIRDKRGVNVPLELTPAQLKLWAAVKRQMDQGRAVRIIVLKSRQVHMSVGTASIIWRRVAFLPGQHAMVYANRSDNTTNVWDYYRQFTENYNHKYSGVKQRKLKGRGIFEGAGQEGIEWAGSSYVYAETAGAKTSARGSSIRHFHLSEGAFWDQGPTVRLGLMQSLPDDADTTLIDESTANGLGGSFHAAWMRAIAGESDFDPVFFGCLEHPENVRRIDMPMDRWMNSMDRTERNLYERHGAKPEQLEWRRWTIQNKCDGSARMFQQEHPVNAEEAFLSSGRTYFDMSALERHPAIEQPMSGRIEEVLIGTRKQIQFVARADGRGELRVWRKPVPNRMYVIGGDAAQGIDVSARQGGTSDPDYSAACVMDQHTGEQVAVLHARLQPSVFAQYTADLGRWYNWAYLVPEANGVGIAYIEGLMQLGYPLHLIFQRRRNATDQRTALLQDLGYLTNETGRPQLLAALDRGIAEMSIQLVDPQTIQECRTLVTKPNGRAEASDGSHDDLVFAAALAAMGIRYAPQDRPGMVTGGAYGQQAQSQLKAIRYT
jgi:hypothetical protein